MIFTSSMLNRAPSVFLRFSFSSEVFNLALAVNSYAGSSLFRAHKFQVQLLPSPSERSTFA